jgi:hypothetical protein
MTRHTLTHAPGEGGGGSGAQPHAQVGRAAATRATATTAGEGGHAGLLVHTYTSSLRPHTLVA